MTIDNIFSSNTGDIWCLNHIRPNEVSSVSEPHVQFNYQADTLSQITLTTLMPSEYDSNSDISTLSAKTPGPKSRFSLPVGYLFHGVSASSEMVGSKFRPVTSPYIEHISSSSLPVSSATSSVTPASPTHSTSLPASGSVSFSSKESLSGQTAEIPNVRQTSVTEQIHMTNMIQFRPRIQREGEFACGWGAAFINICITFPLNKTMFRQQLHGISGLRAVDQLRKDGLRFLYRGLLPPLMQKSFSLSIMFGMYYKCQDMLHEQMPGMNVYVNHTVAALGAGTIEAIFTPFERIQALLQTREYHNKFSNTLDAFYDLRRYGLKEYYRGLSAIVLRNGPSNVAFFLGREYLQLFGPQSHSSGEKVS